MSADLISLIDSLIPSLGWTIVHSLWQGCLFALLLAALLRVMRTARPGPRYIACCATLALMVASAGATFVVLNVRTSGGIDLAALPSAPAVPIAIDVAPPPMPFDAPAPREPAHQPLRYIVVAWLIGVAALSLWHVGGWLCLQTMRRGPRIQTWQANIDRLAARLRITRAVRLVESIRIDVPAVVGILRPVILVPVGILNDLSAQQVEAILAHELAHVRRHDYFVNLLQAAVETLLFYHPATWWISNRIRTERENCCDDIATQMCGDATLYASVLAALEERRLPPLKLAPAVTGGGTLLDRVRRILHLPPLRRASRIRSLAAAALAIACLAVPLAINARQSDAADAPATSQPASVDEAYRIGPGDILQINVDAPTKSSAITARDERVRDDGMILLGLHRMKVAGLSVPEVERAIEKLCRERQLIAEPTAKVQVSESRRPKVRATESGEPTTSPAEPDAAASPIRPEDLKVNAQDYRIGAGDLLQVSIADLVGPGIETVKSVRVSETGNISLPLVGVIKLTGLTTAQAESAIQKAYRDANLLPNAQISVTVSEARGQAFSILGALDRPGQYQIVQPDFRVLDALAIAGGRPAGLTALRVVRKQGEEKQRVIEIPLDRLVAGDADVNVVIRPGDMLIAVAPEKRDLKFVKVVIGKESMLYQGKPIDLPALKAMFEKMSEAERRLTVLEVAAAAPDVTVDRFFKATGQLSDLVKQFNLAHLSQTGIQPTTVPAAAATTQRDVTTQMRLTLAQLLQQRDLLMAEAEQLEEKLGAEHPNTKSTASLLKSIEARIAEQRDKLKARAESMSVEQIAAADATLREYLHTLETMELNLQRLARNVGTKSRIYLDAGKDIELQRKRIKTYVDSFRQQLAPDDMLDTRHRVPDGETMLDTAHRVLPLPPDASPATAASGASPATAPAPSSAPAAPADKPQGADAGLENKYAKLVELARMREQLEVAGSAYLSLGEQHPDRIKYQMMMDTMDQKIEKHLEAHPQLIGTPLATMATMPSIPAAAADEVLSPQLLADATRLAETDPSMQGYVRARAQLLMQSDQYDALGERHPDRIRFRMMLASANQRIRRYHQQVSTTAAATQP